MIRPEQELPASSDVLVIGGGPAGSSVATLLAKQGIDVVLLEKAKHPRPQVGESLIPHFWKYADMTGVSPKLEAERFLAKAGGISVWNDKIHHISFAEFGFTRPALHVERDRFDEILLRHAEDNGVQVFEKVTVKHVALADPGQPIVHVVDKRGASTAEHRIKSRIVVDASGHSSVLASQLKTRRLISSKLKFLSLWGYFDNARYVASDGSSRGPEDLQTVKPVTFVLSFAEGWIWHIPLRRETSVGLVVNTERTKGMSRSDRQRFFLETCASVPYLKDLLEPATYRQDSLCFRPDYSYYSTAPCGENYYCIGDAAAFVDPIYSHGVLNAFYNAAAASMAIVESLKDPARRLRYAKLCENRMQQFYGFSRALALGDFGGDGVDPDLIKSFMRSVPTRELELMLAASHITSRSANFRRMAKEAGLTDSVVAQSKARVIEHLDL